jgi:hypothetical protein
VVDRTDASGDPDAYYVEYDLHIGPAWQAEAHSSCWRASTARERLEREGKKARLQKFPGASMISAHR